MDGPTQVQHLVRIAATLDRVAATLDRILEKLEAAPEPAPVVESQQRAARRESAAEFIAFMLKHEGPKPWVKIEEKAGFYGHRPHTLRNVRNQVAYYKVVDGEWLWNLRRDVQMGEGNGRE